MHDERLDNLNFEALLAKDLENNSDSRLQILDSIDINACDYRSRPLISLLAKVGDDVGIAYLLDKGANPNIKDEYSFVALDYLSQAPRGWDKFPERIHSAAFLLLGQNPEKEVIDRAAFQSARLGLYPFFTAVSALKIKLDAFRSSDGFNLLCELAKYADTSNPKKELEALLIARILVEDCGVNLHAKTKIDLEAKDIAAERKGGILGAYLAYGIEALKKDKSSELKRKSAGKNEWQAISTNDIEALEALIELKGVCEDTLHDGQAKGYTPLAWAARNAKFEALQLLLSKGANPIERNNQKSCYQEDTENVSAFGIFLRAPSKVYNLANSDVWFEMLELFLNNELLPNAPVNAENYLPLHYIAKLSGLSVRIGETSWTKYVISKLIDARAHIDAKVDGLTPLMILARVGSEDSLEASNELIKAGSDVNIIDNDGNTALIYAASIKDANVSYRLVSLLLDSGANPDIKNNLGVSALEQASKVGNEAVVELLLNLVEKKEEDKSQLIELDFESLLH